MFSTKERRVLWKCVSALSHSLPVFLLELRKLSINNHDTKTGHSHSANMLRISSLHDPPRVAEGDMMLESVSVRTGPSILRN